MNKDKLIKTLTKASNFEKNMPIEMARSFNDLEEKIDAIPDNKEVLEAIEKNKVQKVQIEGAELLTIKGEKGDKGDKGDTGEKGEQGIQGEKGLDGKDGKDGRDGIDGIDGRDGKDGTSADEKIIIEKLSKIVPTDDIETLKTQIAELESLIKKLPKSKGSIYSAVAALKSITAGDQISVDNTLFGHPVVAFTGYSGLTKITVGTTEPTSPTTGDLWVDTN